MIVMLVFLKIDDVGKLDGNNVLTVVYYSAISCACREAENIAKNKKNLNYFQSKTKHDYSLAIPLGKNVKCLKIFPKTKNIKLRKTLSKMH
jgi:hypothetical protein